MPDVLPLAMRGHGGQGADVTGAEEIKVEKRSEEMLKQREMRLAKEALLEGHASRFNRHFIGAAENFEKARLQKMSEQSRITYEMMMERHQYRMQAENILGKMVRQDRKAIFDLMQNQAEMRRKDEALTTRRQNERERWLLARQIYEQMESEKRQRQREENSKQTEDKANQKATLAEEGKQRASEERAEQARKNASKQQNLSEKAKDRRLEKSRARAEDRLAPEGSSSKQQQKVEEADKRRQHIHEEVTRVAREAAERRDQKLSRSRQIDEIEFDCRQQDHLDRNVALERAREAERRRRRRREGSRTADAAQRQREEQAPPPSAVHGGATGGDAGEEAKKAIPKETKGPKPPSVFYYCGPETSKELQDAHSRAQRDYVQKAHQLDESREGMLLRGRFKDLAESARNLGDRFEGGNTRRLRSVRKSLIRADKLADAAGTAGASTSASDTLASSTQSTSRAPPSMRWQPCALCERDFPGESLEGRAKRSAVVRARQQLATSPKPSQVHSARAALGHSSASVSISLPASPGASASMDPVSATGNSSATAEAPLRGPGTLYDYEVWLCTACWHHMRLYS